MSRLLVFAYGVMSYSVFLVSYLYAVVFVGVLLVMFALPSSARAQNHSHAVASSNRHLNALVQAVRDATERFKDVAVAENEEYQLLFGCVTDDDKGAMGLHWVNLPLVFDGGELDPTRPEIILYEPLPSGRLRITGADFLVIAKDWDDAHPGNPPQLMGQLFHRSRAPIDSGCRRSTHCTSGRGRKAPAARS